MEIQGTQNRRAKLRDSDFLILKLMTKVIKILEKWHEDRHIGQ